jgi:hypothetical protein
MRFTTPKRALAAIAACALLGTGVGIAGAGAATSTTKARSSQSTTTNANRPPDGMRRGMSVHSEEVVLDKAGDKFITETEDNGVVKSVSGNDLTLTEGTKTVTYKDVTTTIADGATIMRNGKTAQLSDLKAGDHVHVSQSSDGTNVFAGDDSFRPPHGGPGGPGGPPPGAPPA